MLLIYTSQTSPRLQYICKFIFEEMMGTAYSITLHRRSFEDHDGPKINYTENNFSEDDFHLIPHTLLFEENITPQLIYCTGEKEKKIFFKIRQCDHSFDILAATFFLISRYEEYLPHTKDVYGRFAHENSAAFKNGFLNIPLVNFWVIEFAEKLKSKFPALIFKQSKFSFLPTYDIDMAWSYKEKGLVRNLGGFLKRPSLERVTTLLGIKDDPFYSFKFLDDLHILNNLKPLYFFLVAKETGVYDKNILPSNIKMHELINRTAAKYQIGLHPSWKSNDDDNILKEEKKIMEEISSVSINSSRQHYIKFELPQTFKRLLSAGITNDYSVGYGSINGFRASVASSFNWYDLSTEKITSLRIHPFCFMDANSFYEQRQSAENSYHELMHYFLICKKINGDFITIFHNNFLGTDKKFKGWKNLYTKFISQVQ
jgi:hypothetical protein